MKEVTTETALDLLLDTYVKESEDLYNTTRKILLYPLPREEDEDYAGNLEGKLYATGFAFIIRDYFLEALDSSLSKEYDSSGFVEDMYFEEHKDVINKMLENPTEEEERDLDYSENFDAKVFVLGQRYKHYILKDLSKIFTSSEYMMRYFASIFPDDAPGIDALAFGDVSNYFEENFKR